MEEKMKGKKAKNREEHLINFLINLFYLFNFLLFFNLNVLIYFYEI